MREKRRWRSRDDAELGASIVAIILMVVMFLWVHGQGQKLDRQQQNLAAQQRELRKIALDLGADRLFIVESCNRLQIVRVEDNVSHYADYKVYRVVYAESRAALAHHLVKPSQLRAEHRFLSQLNSAIHEKSWVPVTNCKQAVNRSGIGYAPPHPVLFINRLPPRSALVLPESAFSR